MKSFKQAFESFCKKNSIKKNNEQLDLVEKFEEFDAIIKQDKTLIKKLFSKTPVQLGYYIYGDVGVGKTCLLYTSPSPRDRTRSRMPSSA